MNGTGKKVVLGMSGGVDSSVSAVLLKSQGYEVSGVFLDFWQGDEKNFEDAKKVADSLGITLHRIDARKEFKEKIVDHFLEEYKHGRTPNPCVMCNPKMKFRILFDEMLKTDADFMATGHYARVMDGRLLRGVDKIKDQSYFLYGLDAEQLKKIIFPLGDKTKEEVRNLAEKNSLAVASKPESQDVCFVQEKDFSDFLKKHLEINKGNIVDTNGIVLGEHMGLSFYTIGQRKGINLGGKGPYYVVGKNIEKNQLVVTNEKNSVELFTGEVVLGEVNWIRKIEKFPFQTRGMLRYGSGLVDIEVTPIFSLAGFIFPNKRKYLIKFFPPQRMVAPGQSAVFYDGEEVVGGGIIKA